MRRQDTTPRAHGWTRAHDWSDWTRGAFSVNTITIGTGRRRGDNYLVTRQGETKYQATPEWAEVERIAERRQGERRKGSEPRS
jgi:hypothetical protein